MRTCYSGHCFGTWFVAAVFCPAAGCSGTSEGVQGNFDGMAIYNSWVVGACVSNSFHLPDSPVNHAFIFALDKKQPGVRPTAPRLCHT